MGAEIGDDLCRFAKHLIGQTRVTSLGTYFVIGTVKSLAEMEVSVMTHIGYVFSVICKRITRMRL